MASFPQIVLCVTRAATLLLAGLTFLGAAAQAQVTQAQVTQAPISSDLPGRGPLSGIIDRAELFTTPERTEMRKRLARIAERFETDVFVISINDDTPSWSSLPTHRDMVQRANRELDEIRQGVVSTKRTLTALVVFKRQPILHFTSDLKPLHAVLYASKFYAGFDAASFKVRASNETHGAAVVHYLAALEERTQSVAPMNLSAINPVWFVAEQATKTFALFLSRDIWATLSSMVRIGPQWMSDALAATLDVITRAAGLGVFALFGLGMLAYGLGEWLKREVGGVLERWRLSPKTWTFAILKFCIVLVPKLLLFGPILAAIYTIATYDVENILFLSQRFGMPLDVLLARAKDAHTYNFDFTWAAAFVFVGALLSFEMFTLWVEGRSAASGNDDGGENERLSVGTVGKRLVLTALPSIALGLLPGVAAAFGGAYLILERIIRIYRAVRGWRKTSRKLSGSTI